MVDNNYNADTEPNLIKILLDLQSDLHKVIERGENLNNGYGKINTYNLSSLKCKIVFFPYLKINIDTNKRVET